MGRSSTSLPPPLNRQILLNRLFSASPRSALFTVIPGFSQVTANPTTPDDNPTLPPLLSSLYDPKYQSLSHIQLVDISKQKFANINVTTEEAIFLEVSTRGQSQSTLWYNHRVGRITASKFGRAAKCKMGVYPTSLVESIMQYKCPDPSIPALRWGRVNEERAFKEYEAFMLENHVNFTVRHSGLCLHADYPFLGASPDGVTNCQCCGEGLLEIKCTFKYRHVHPNTIRDTTFCVDFTTDPPHLRENHEYFYQVQGQLALCEKTHCDFVCWTTKGMIIDRVRRNKEFFDAISPKLKEIFINYICPEILARKLQQPPSSASSAAQVTTHEDESHELCDDDVGSEYCFCRQGEYGSMIACDAPNCPIEWFHFSCVGLTEEPDGEWICDNCK